MGYQCTTLATQEPVSLEEARLHCRIDSHDEDGYLAALITTARRWVERQTGLQLVQSTWTWTLDRLPYTMEPLYVPVSPLVSVTSIKYIDGSGIQQTLANTSYIVDATSMPGRIALVYGQVWPIVQLRANAVEVVFKAGYGSTTSTAPQSAAAVPRTIKMAILLLVGHWYANREQTSENSPTDIPFGVESLLAMEAPGSYL